MADDDQYFSGAGKTAPSRQIIRSLKDHGMDYTYIDGVLHGVSPGDPPVPIGDSVPKLKDFLGYKRGGKIMKAGAKAHGGKSRGRRDKKARRSTSPQA